MHTAILQRIGLSADGAVMATGSYDKTVRLWLLPEAKLLKTLRVPIGPDGNSGKVFAVALAPDGSWVAAGGWDARWETSGETHIYILDTKTGAILARLGPLPSVVDELRVSPDGERLAAGLQGANGRSVFIPRMAISRKRPTGPAFIPMASPFRPTARMSRGCPAELFPA
jgi:WD40 repeat protein